MYLFVLERNILREAGPGSETGESYGKNTEEGNRQMKCEITQNIEARERLICGRATKIKRVREAGMENNAEAPVKGEKRRLCGAQFDRFMQK